MATLKEVLTAVNTLAERVAALEATPARVTSRAKSKRVKDTRTLSERRDAAVGGVCEQHDKRFATPSGYAWHMENVAHE